MTPPTCEWPPRWSAAGNTQDSNANASWRVPAPNLAELRWLRRQDVSRAAILCPWSIGATNVTFHGTAFELATGGERVLTFLVEDCGEVIDVAAWQPRTGQIATWLGTGFAIGQEAIFNPATYFVTARCACMRRRCNGC